MVTSHSYAQSAYINGYIYTADSNNTVCEVVAIADGYIIATGSTQQIEARINKHTHVVDLQGKTMLPGIIDAHLHPF